MDNQNFTTSAGTDTDAMWRKFIGKIKIINLPGVEESILILSKNDFQKFTELAMIEVNKEETE
jgi:hypothetical protein